MNDQLRGPILIGFAEALAAPETAFSLRAAGLPVAAFTRRGKRPPLRKHPEVPVHAVTAPEQSAAEAISELKALATTLGAVALLPLDDPAVWLCDRVAAELGLPVIGATGPQARLALDKRLQFDAARAAGLPVPETVVLDQASDALNLDEFPLVLKPAFAVTEIDGRLDKAGGAVCANRDELVATVQRWRAAGPILAQPWIAGSGEGVFGIAVDGEVRSWSAHRRLRMVNPQGSGSSACISAVPEEAITASGARMMVQAGWEGLFMLEILRDKHGTPWFMELNGRTWGSLALARRLGFEYPAWAASERLGLGHPQGPEPVARPEVVSRHLGREILHTLSVLRGPKSTALVEWPGRWETLRSVTRLRRGEGWYNWSREHPAIFLDDTLQTVRGAMPRGRSR
ncbi:hypothetical protein OM076_42140 [Solirubrobacter ginsenosidimutans]|uniref:ATP-grasp domain-containing protein n=1 Tax=Solirubrobacter ginsenosidimutans TaxID=490573 RepID=A0A9X3S8F0_9ACTN|nr:hypothetical protein [Solirubrobacter ginsenosidimutans]MDA0166936.1 hypothetical protein [Solirubrobacter ginsenosidimutans]